MGNGKKALPTGDGRPVWIQTAGQAVAASRAEQRACGCLQRQIAVGDSGGAITGHVPVPVLKSSHCRAQVENHTDHAVDACTAQNVLGAEHRTGQQTDDDEHHRRFDQSESDLALLHDVPLYKDWRRGDCLKGRQVEFGQRE